MASYFYNPTVANLEPGLQTSNLMPRRRKRHLNKMSLVLLIFVGCCLTLILSPLHVQAKESNNATSKGENMLSNDRQSHQHEEGETNINGDKTNDNGTFKRLEPTDIKTKNDGPNDRLEEEEETEGDDEHSSEVIEMIQPAHTLRHQEHYKQRMLLAEKHEQKQQQQQQQQEEKQEQHHQHQHQHLDGNAKNDGNGIDVGDDIADEQERELFQYNRNLRYKQIQQALREPLAFPEPHHRRHEHHLAKQRLAKETELIWPQQHHLRHQHHHSNTQEFPHHNHQPQLRHLKHEIRKQNITATKSKPLVHHQRYFDRESSFINPINNVATTEGPHLRHTGSKLHWKSVTYLKNPHNRLINDEGKADIKRFSLSLEGHEHDQDKDEHEKQLNNKAGLEYDKDTNYDASDSKDDDYSYEDDGEGDDVDKEVNKQNQYPSSTNKAKSNVKRYTNALKPLNRPSSYSSPTYTYRNQYNGHHLRHMPSHNVDIFKTNSNNDNNNEGDDNGNGDGDGGDEDDDDDEYDDIENSESSPSSEDDIDNDNVSDDEDDEDKMSDEKWNKIEHEHYRKQLQHQRAMQALRSRRPPNDNNPNTNNLANASKYSSHAAASMSSSSAINNAWTKRQILNGEENDNIYSRYYVPGSVTRKKEEELGSPVAIVESRRQYALQQRHNKALASAHHRRIVTEGSCRWPQPRVERIRKDSWKIYTPHCTILHRCADDAGCCPSERQTCAPKRTKNVDLYFFVISLNETQGSIEKLTFVNHTECHCIDRSKQRAPEYASSSARDLLANNNQIPYLRRATILNCFCPNLFEKILQEDGFCRCDCSSGNMGCDWLKRGMEHFSMNDRKCIIEGRCKLPTCEYGQYIKKHGRCPRREERHLSADIDW